MSSTAAEKALAVMLQRVNDRRQDFSFLRKQGLTVRAASERLGVCERTGWRYERHRDKVSRDD